MRFSSTAILALPLLAAAAESPFEQYKAKFQNFLSSFGASAPAADKAEPAAAAAAPKSKAKAAPKKIENLTLENWKDTVYAPVKPGATTPEEWYILVSGGNKTCYGHCGKLDAAFKESAAKFATQSNTPHLARLDCEDQQPLCNSWGASAGSLWVFEMLPQPAPIDVYWKPLNLSTVSTQTILDLQAKPVKESFRLVESYFHPFNGVLADYGLAVPIGYILYFFNIVPSWAFMLIVSFLSRSVMNRQMDPTGGRPAAPRGAAPPGDARS
jgi:hypothetical protein